MLRDSYPGLKLITFDLDDTLWPCLHTIMRAEEALFEWLQQRAPRLAADHTIESMRAHRHEIAQSKPEIAHDMTQLRICHLKILLESYDHNPALAYQATEFFQQYRNLVEPYSDVTDALLKLRESYTLVSVTNGNAQVEKTPLAGLFDYSLTAADVGYAKPHPAIFHKALELANAAPQEALHLGDDVERDVIPALATGMHALHVLRDQASCGCSVSGVGVVEGVPQISSLDELFQD